ncbi:hypothetical protein B0T26DRAFT_658684, partial [Lasiosphaeria miniovina]
ALFLLRIFMARAHRYIIYASVVCILVMSFVYLFIVLFQCSPISHFYGQVLGQPGTCVDQNIVPGATTAFSVVSAAVDFVLALMPIAILWNVRLGKPTKFGIAALGTGIL